MKKVSFTKVLDCDIATVFNVVCDLKNFSWRSDIVNITILEDGKSFVEHTKDGYETLFTITKKIDLKHYEFNISNSNLTGHWTGLFCVVNKKTKIEFIEEVTPKKAIMNLFVTGYLKKNKKHILVI